MVFWDYGAVGGYEWSGGTIFVQSVDNLVPDYNTVL
jgi:hypothetical protein